jgi:heat-inducible transcriptional repressor
MFGKYSNAHSFLFRHSSIPDFVVKWLLIPNRIAHPFEVTMMIDDRARSILKTLVERYITEGCPVGSRALSKWSTLDLSPATIRNVMADLEDLRLVVSPHTSAGRVPTPQGYRMFVDSLLTVKPLAIDIQNTLSGGIQREDPNRVLNKAVNLLSSLSSFAGVITAPKKTALFRQVEFLSLSDRKVLLIIVTPDGDVQNRILIVEKPYTQSELTMAANFFNQHFVGLTFSHAKQRLSEELNQISQDISALMQAAVNAGTESEESQTDGVLFSGERKLLDVSELSTDMERLRKMFSVFEQRTALLRLLESSNRAEGVQIFIGGDSSLVPMKEMSVISASYHVNGQVVGTLGVIGPTRMAYERLIPIVDITSKLVSSALSDPE